MSLIWAMPPPNYPLTAPGAIPLLGHTRLMRLEKLSVDLAKVHREQKSQILQLQLFGNRIYHLRNPADIAVVMNNRGTDFGKPPGIARLHRWLGKGLPAQADPSEHAKQHALLNPAFRQEYISGLYSIFASCSLKLAEAMKAQAHTPFDIQDMCRRAALDVIGLAGFNCDLRALDGIDRERTSQMEFDALAAFDGLNDAAMKLAFDLPLPDFLIPGYSSYCQSIEHLDSLVSEVIQKRRSEGLKNSDVDLLAFLMRSQSQNNGNFPSDKLMRDEIMTMLFAGTDTTSYTLAFILHCLAIHPDAQDRVAAEVQSVCKAWKMHDLEDEDLKGFAKLPFTAACIKETLRLFNTAVGAPRVAVTDTTLSGVTVPKGTICISDIYCLHRNEEFWPEPDEWKPERFLASQTSGNRDAQAFMPFLTGPRSCIGRNFALLELQIATCVLVGSLVFRTAQTELDVVQDLTLKSKDGIFVAVEPR